MGRPLALLTLCACGQAPKPIPDAMTSHWTDGPALPSPRLEPGVAAVGTRLIVLGGIDTTVAEGLHVTQAVDAFDTQAQSWLDPLPAAPLALTHVNLAGVGDTLYLLGALEGLQYVARGESWALDNGATAWRPLAAMPAGLERGASGVVSTATHVFVLGGASTTAAIATCLDYDIGADTWTELPALPAPRSHPAAMLTSDGTLIVAGGLSTLDSTEPLGDVWALPPGATAWEPRAAMLDMPRGGCAYGVVAGGLVCAGGESGHSALRVVDSYDPARDEWIAVEVVPEYRAGMQGAAIDGKLYVAGGAPALAFLPVDTMFVYSP